jgi:outer membrane lipoprotein-sorting protein
MKKLFLFVFFLFVLNGFNALAQCNAETLSTQCIPKLASGFNFLKSYKVEKGGKEYVEYSYVFTKGTQYMINICEPGQIADGITVTLYDSDRNKVATNKVDDQYASSIVYACNKIGIYYIHYTFEDTENCGGSALGFKR